MSGQNKVLELPRHKPFGDWQILQTIGADVDPRSQAILSHPERN